MWFVNPLHGAARLGEVNRDQIVGEWRDDVHCVAEDERLPLVTVGNAGRERRDYVQVHDVRGLDRVECAVAKIAVVAGRHTPLAGGDVGHEMDAGSGARHTDLPGAPPAPRKVRLVAASRR